MSSLVTVFRSRFAPSWPDHDHGDAPLVLSAAEAFSQRFDTDAHMACYVAPGCSRRLSVRAVSRTAIAMVLLVFDLDDPVAHAERRASGDEWWGHTRAKIVRLAEEHPGLFAFRTRGGARVVYLAPPGAEIRSDADARRWKRLYASGRTYLRERFDLEADRACESWNWLFRLPFVRRDGAREERETLGELAGLAPWPLPVPEEDDTPEPRPFTAVVTTDVPGDGYVRAALASAAVRVASAPKGERNATLNREAWCLAGLGIPHETVGAVLRDAASSAGLTAPEIGATLASALRAGASAPRPPPTLPPGVVRSFLDAALAALGHVVGSYGEKNRVRCVVCGRDDAVSFAPRDRHRLGSYACRCGARREDVLDRLPPLVKADASRAFPRALSGVVYRAAKRRAARIG